MPNDQDLPLSQGSRLQELEKAWPCIPDERHTFPPFVHFCLCGALRRMVSVVSQIEVFGLTPTKQPRETPDPTDERSLSVSDLRDEREVRTKAGKALVEFLDNMTAEDRDWHDFQGSIAAIEREAAADAGLTMFDCGACWDTIRRHHHEDF